MKNRPVKEDTIVSFVRDLSLRAGTVLRQDVESALKKAYIRETKHSKQKDMLGLILENIKIARKKKLAICQDTGMVSVFVSIGENVKIEGNKGIIKLINQGVREAYKNAYFRKSIVLDPLTRKNSGTNTPAIIHLNIVKGEKVKISVIPKGFGSENKSRLVMLNPTDGEDKIVDFCVDTVKKAGPDACPPYILGIGLGGSFEEVTSYAKRALLRPILRSNKKKHMKDLEYKILKRLNSLNIGVMGLGGKTTVLGVNIVEGPTHIAGLPLAVNLSCWALRSASGVL